MNLLHRTALIGVILVTGCTVVGPNYQRPTVALPAAYDETTPAETGTLSATWWTLYNDATLTALVEATLQNNADLHKAAANIDEVAATLAEVDSASFPEVDLGGSSTRSRSSALTAQHLPPGSPAVSTSHRLALSTSFELDFWGKLRRATEAARAQMLGSRYAKDVVALTLASATTQAYFSLRGLDAQIVMTQDTLTAREETLAVVQRRAGGGLASDLEINQAQGARADASTQWRELQRQRVLIEHQLGNLTGQPALKMAAGNLMNLPTPALPPAGLPSTLLDRRPDVRQAEQLLATASAQIGVAKAAQLPTFSLTSSFGGQSATLSNLLKDGARIWSLGLSGTFPIFDAGKYAARTRGAEARQQQALANYQKTVEAAFRDVADALSNVQYTTAAIVDVQAKADAARNALRLSQLRYQAGYAGYLDVLDAQRTANAAEQTLLQNRQAQLAYSVDVMKALGGGWSATAPVAQR